MRDPVTTTTPATAAAPVEPTPAPAARKRAARAPRAKVAVVASAPEVVAPVEAPKPVTPAKKAAVRKSAKAVKLVKPAEAPQPAAPTPAAVKHKLIRDSFTFPENEYAQIEDLKHKALSLAHHAKKSEILRAGIAALSVMSDKALVAALKAVPPLKTGRPKSGKKR